MDPSPSASAPRRRPLLNASPTVAGSVQPPSMNQRMPTPIMNDPIVLSRPVQGQLPPGPFTAEFSGLVIRGCPAVGNDHVAMLRLQLQNHHDLDAEFELMTADYAIMTPRKRAEIRRWRRCQMLYTVCYDTNRYPAPFPECHVDAAERQMFWEWGESKVVRGRSGGKRRQQVALGTTTTSTPAPRLVSLQQAD